MIIGNSGCTIEFKNGLAIKSNTNYPIDRLKKQANKQKYYSKLYLNNIIVPTIYKTIEKNNIYYVHMKYYNAQDMIQFFEKVSILKIQHFLDTIVNFINFNLNNSIEQQIDFNQILDKYEQVKPNNVYDKIFYSYPSNIVLPIGTCHGDLTLSNILYYNNQFVLIDFLDSFIETPIMDIAKLQQDLRYYWSLFLYNNTYNQSRIYSIFHYLSSKLDYYFSQYLEYQKLLEILCLMRILPYCKDTQTTNFVKEKLCLL